MFWSFHPLAKKTNNEHLGLFQTSCYYRAKVEFNSSNLVRHGTNTTFETGLTELMAALVAWTLKPRKVWNSWSCVNSHVETNWHESSSFLAFSEKRNKEKKGKACPDNLDPTRTPLVTSQCENILMCHLNNFVCIFVFQFSKSLAKEVLHSQRRNVYISSLTGKNFLNK